MNNLKRVLSLALSGIMLVGMMAMGASAADFTDADTIVHQDAVDILVALDIINGQDDGSFNPQGNVTRAQMAKMIAVAMKGGNDVSTGTKGTASFTDIKGHWAESYIEYCYDLGVISGRGDGTFAPDDNVTGIEATKMVLTALGYDSEAYKLTGAAWATRADELARQADPQLYEELSGVVLDKPASRDTAAQLIWNGLQNDTRIVRPTTNKNNGEVQWTYEDGPMMLTARYNGLIFTGVFGGNRLSGITACEKGEISVTGDIATTNSNGNVVVRTVAAHFPSTLDIDYIGEEVRVIYKNGVRSTSAAPDKNDTIYGVFLTGTTPVIRTTRDKLAGVKTDKAVLKVDGTEYDLDPVSMVRDENNTLQYNGGGVMVNVNLTGGSTNRTEAYYKGTTAGDGDISQFAKDYCYKNGDAVKILLNDRNEIDRMYITTAKLAMVTNVNGDKVTMNNSVGTIKKSVNDIYEGIAKDDVVTITTLYDTDPTDDDAYSIVKKAEVVSGTLKAYKIDKEGTADENIVNVTLDDTAYSIYHKDPTKVDSATQGLDYVSPINLGSKRISDLTAPGVLGSEVDAYMVNGFVGAIKKTSTAATNYSVVMEIRDNTQSSSVFSNFQLYVMDGEGTKTIINVNDEVEDKTLTAAKIGDEAVENQTIDLTDIKNMKDKFTPKGGTTATTAGKWVDKKPASVFTVGDIITYTKDKNGNADVTIEARATQTTTGYDKDTKTFNGKVTDPNAVVFVQTKGSYSFLPGASTSDTAGTFQTGAGLTFKAYKIADLGNIKDGTATTMVTASDKVVAGFVALGKEPNGSTSNEVYGIVTAGGSTTKIDGSNYTEYTVSVNGESSKVYVKSGSLKEGQVVRYEPTSDNLYANATKFALNSDKSFSAYVEEYDADRDIITFFTGNLVGKDDVPVGSGKWTRYELPQNPSSTEYKTYAVANDVKIYAVDKDAKTSEPASATSVAGFNTNTGKRNVILVTSGTGIGNDPYVVEVIIVEISGQADIDKDTSVAR